MGTDLEKSNLTPDELRLELACALYARGRLGKIRGAELAGVDFFAFQRALGERQIPSYTAEMLHKDIASLERAFPRVIVVADTSVKPAPNFALAARPARGRPGQAHALPGGSVVRI
jgi:predicted HTH domain antitoxin